MKGAVCRAGPEEVFPCGFCGARVCCAAMCMACEQPVTEGLLAFKLREVQRCAAPLKDNSKTDSLSDMFAEVDVCGVGQERN